MGTVVPAIKAELERRSRPKRTWGANSPIAKLKGLDIVDLASTFTELTGTGDQLKGAHFTRNGQPVFTSIKTPNDGGVMEPAPT